MRFSASRISTWMNCPLQAHFKYDMHMPTRQGAKASFGSIIHHVLDGLNRGVLDAQQAEAEFLRIWDDPSIMNLTPEYWPKYTTYSSLKTKGKEIIREYAEKSKWETKKFVASEHPFLVPFGEHELTGFVDFLDIKKTTRGNRTLRVVDLKTAGRQPTKVELRLNVQFTVYTYAAMQPEFFMGNGPDFPPLPNGEQLFTDLERVPRRAFWYHLMTNKEIDAGERDDGDFMRLYRVCNEIANAVDKKVFVPKIGEACVWCDFADPCGMPIPTEDDLEEQEI